MIDYLGKCENFLEVIGIPKNIEGKMFDIVVLCLHQGKKSMYCGKSFIQLTYNHMFYLKNLIKLSSGVLIVILYCFNLDL